MPDREKVIFALRYCRENMCGPECPYYYDDINESPADCILERVTGDVLALLKGQEAKMVVQTTSTIRCPGCGKQITSKGAIHKEIKYCWKCGQAVKWE